MKKLLSKIWLFLDAWAEARVMQDIMINQYRSGKHPSQGA
jgi:hypothetical protein